MKALNRPKRLNVVTIRRTLTAVWPKSPQLHRLEIPSMKQRILITLVLLILVGPIYQSGFSQDVAKDFSIPQTDEGLVGSGPIRRYAWFQSLWKNRRSQWAKEVERDQRALVFLGDSITQGWGENMGNSFPGVKVANRGISGDTTRGMLIRLKEDVLTLNPSGVVMLMGTNDLEELVSPSVIANNIKLIVASLKQHNAEMPIVLCRILPSSATKTRPAEKIQETNALIAKAVKGDPQVTVLDTWTLFANAQGDAKVDEFPDLLHPNEKGYAKWAMALRPVLATHGFLDRDVQTQKLEPGYESLFNGMDLTGWQFRPSTDADKKASANWRKNDPNAPPWPILTRVTDFENKTASTNSRYVAKNGRLVVTHPPEGRKIQQIWTAREFPNDFVLKLEFRATPNADSGIFLRGRQMQCRDYALAGPYKDLKHYRPQDWNEIVVVVNGRTAYCTCNGEVLEEAFKVPASGPIGLEGDRGQVEYRNIRVKEITPELPRSLPEQQGVRSQAILDFIDGADKIDSVHSFMLLRHGSVVAEAWWAPFSKDEPHQLYSLSKSFTSTAVGLAIADGKMSLDDTVVSFFPDDLPENPSANLKAMRVRDLLSMSTGHVSSDLRAFSFQSENELTKEFLALPVEHSPGTHFVYNTPATYMCSAIVQKVTGETVVDYLQPRLFDPLGIEKPYWTESPQRISHGGFGLNLRTEDIARFGQLYLQEGEWNGRQVIPADWVAAATSRQTSNGSNPDSDWNQGYGYQFWRCRHGFYRGDGAFGQYCIVMPEHDAVLAITSGTGNMGAIMQLAWDHLLPGMAMSSLSRNDAGVAALRERIESLELSVATGVDSSPRAKSVSGSTYEFPKNEHGIKSVKVTFGDDATLVINDQDGQHDFPCGRGEWRRTRMESVGALAPRLPRNNDVAVAATGAWADDTTYAVRIWMHETPYRLDLKLLFDGDNVTLSGSYNVAFGPKILPELVGTR